jgi:hypothetical protein
MSSSLKLEPIAFKFQEIYKSSDVQRLQEESMKVILILAYTFVLTGCAVIQKTKPTLPPTTRVPFEFSVIDSSKRAVPNAEIFVRSLDLTKYSIEVYNGELQSNALPENTKISSCVTDQNGRCNIPMDLDFGLFPKNSSSWCFSECAKKIGRYSDLDTMFRKKYRPIAYSEWGYGNYISLYVTGGGLFGSPGKEDVFFFQSDTNNAVEVEIDEVERVQEYFCGNLKTPESALVATSLVKWANSLSSTISTTQAKISKPNGICVSDFKGGRYLRVNLISQVKFNTNKLTDYQIGGLIFDEAIRQILSPLGGAVKELPFDGYDLAIRTHRENFVNKNNSVEYRDLVFRFLIPKQVTVRYKNKDITGQQLIDESVILINDERDTLKLQ